MEIYKWKINYEAEVKGIFSDRIIEITDDKNSVNVEIEIKNQRDSVYDKIEFRCLDFESTDEVEAKENTKLIVNDIINLLATNYSAVFTKPFITFKQEFGKRAIITGKIILRNQNVIELNEEMIEKLKVDLKNDKLLNTLKTNRQQQLFRNILFSEELIGNFIAMYSVLDEIINTYGTEDGRGQKKVDNFIKSQTHYWNSSDDKDSTKHKDNNGIPIKETKYTWLRNQLGHTQLSSKIEEVELEIHKCYPDLIRLVQEAINKYITNSANSI